MSTTTGGLHSIAMALEHLERIQSKDNNKEEKHVVFNLAADETEEASPQKTAEVVSRLEEPPISHPVVPARRGFGQRTVRIVSADHMPPPPMMKLNENKSSEDAEDQKKAEKDTSDTTSSAMDMVLEPVAPPARQDDPKGETVADSGPNGQATPSTSTDGNNSSPPDKSTPAVTISPNPPSPSEIISRVMPHDVLCGRGGETNHHQGNIQYRQLVKACQPAYIAAKRREKPKIAEKIVRTVRELGGRFLKKDSATGTWKDVGNTKAREKTSQALREGAPELRGTQSKGKGDAPSAAPPSATTGEPGVPSLSPAVVVPEPASAAAAPSPVKTAGGGGCLITKIQPSNKKRKTGQHPGPTTSLASFMSLPAAMGVVRHPAVAGVRVTVPVGEQQRHQPVIPALIRISSSGLATSSSSSEEDDYSPTCNAGNNSNKGSFSRGPRIKLLKRRLASESQE